MNGCVGLGPLGRSCILTLFGTGGNSDLGTGTHATPGAPWSATLLKAARSIGAAAAGGAGKGNGRVDGSVDRGVWTGEEESGCEATEGRSRHSPGGPSGIAPVSPSRNSSTRVNAALRRWSVEREEVHSVQAAERTAERLTERREERPMTIVEDARQSGKELPASSEQNAGSDCAQEEMNRTERRQPEEERAREEAAEEEQASEPEQGPDAGLPEDYYDVLQISRGAELETIHRVYRIMALRFHPDNAKTGNLERFLLLKRAYQVLSDPQQRAAYDAAHRKSDTQPLPHFESKDFVYGVEGEVNRRLGVLSLLYHKRRMGEGKTGMSVLDLENRMAFPREYFTFTLWYLRSKNYIMRQENSDYALTAEGVDYVEAHSMSNRVIRQLLTSGCEEGDGVSDERPRGEGVAFSAGPKPAPPRDAA